MEELQKKTQNNCVRSTRGITKNSHKNTTGFDKKQTTTYTITGNFALFLPLCYIILFDVFLDAIFAFNFSPR